MVYRYTITYSCHIKPGLILDVCFLITYRQGPWAHIKDANIVLGLRLVNLLGGGGGQKRWEAYPSFRD